MSRGATSRGAGASLPARVSGLLLWTLTWAVVWLPYAFGWHA